MLPKKRKFDLSTFDLERGPGNSSSGVVVTNSSVTVTVTSSKSSSGSLHPGSYTVRPTSIHEIPTSKAIPASGFLPPETVHEAFAGSSFVKAAGELRDGRQSRVRQSPNILPSTRQSPNILPSSNNIVDLSQSSSAFSRPSPSPSHLRVKPQYEHSQSFISKLGRQAGPVSLVLDTEQVGRSNQQPRGKAGPPHR